MDGLRVLANKPPWKELAVRAIVSTFTLALFAVVVVGCAKKATSSIPENTSVTDITPAPAPAYQPVQPAQPVNNQPVVYDSMQNSTGTGAAGAAAIGGGPYTVKKGDTLYSIARSHYGDGKQWQRIAVANPGLEPSKLRVGQTITIP